MKRAWGRRVQRLAMVGVVCVLATVVWTPRVSAQVSSGPQAVFFSATNHTLHNQYGFLNYWRANGQLLRFGYPITDVFEEDGRPVQYFERARFEYHADIGVLLGLLGREATGYQAFPVGSPVPGRLFPETGYTVYGKFLQYWRQWGGLPVFGYPISESFELMREDGSIVAAQYFERARIEYHPANVIPYYDERRQANGTAMLTLHEMQLGQIGKQVAIARGINLSPGARPEGVPDWSPALWPQRIEVDISAQTLTAYEGDVAVMFSGVSTGRDEFNTVTGTYRAGTKLLYDDMTGTAEGEEYDVRKVPYVMYFYLGYAIHGTYWHDDFGTGVRRSHGCVNLPLDKAEWLWHWSQPAWSAERATRVSPPSVPYSRAEADLQPLEGLAVTGAGPTVIVRP